MRLLTLLFVLAVTAALVSAQWSKDDYEIFDLQQALEKDEGEGVTFYSIFNLTKGASAAQIRKAYRARSMELHPDKHPHSKTASRRFERLGIINKILRDERRDRYDHFLKNGFPRWRGTGYFYARYRPGLGFVVFFLALVTSAVHFAILTLNYRRDKKRLDTLVSTAKLLAWGPRFRSVEAGLAKRGESSDFVDIHNKGVIVPPEKKVRLPLGGMDIPPLAPKSATEDEATYWDNDEKAIRKAMATKGPNECCGTGGRRFIEALVTRDEGVFVMEPGTQDLMPLDDGATIKPTVHDTWLVQYGRNLVNRFSGANKTAQDAAPGQDDVKAEVVNGYDVVDKAIVSGKKGKQHKKKKQ